MRIETPDRSRRSPRDLDLKIGATRVEMVKSPRGWLWRCPKCQRLVLHLYTLDEVTCRHCARVDGAKVDYACRRVGRDMPEAARVRKLREKIGADPRPFAPLPPRRKWARRASWLRALRAIAEQEERLAARFAAMTEDLERRARVRGLKP